MSLFDGNPQIWGCSHQTSDLVPVVLDQCKVHPTFQHMFTECNSYYSWETEDEGSYFPNWSPDPHTHNETDEELTNNQKDAWHYNTAWELKGTPYWASFSTYWGGGEEILLDYRKKGE